MAKAIAVNMSDIFDGGAFVGVVNAPDLGAVAKVPHAVPYVKLAEKIGSMQAQLLRNNKIASLQISLRGKDVAETKLAEVIKSAGDRADSTFIFRFVKITFREKSLYNLSSSVFISSCFFVIRELTISFALKVFIKC